MKSKMKVYVAFYVDAFSRHYAVLGCFKTRKKAYNSLYDYYLDPDGDPEYNVEEEKKRIDMTHRQNLTIRKFHV